MVASLLPRYTGIFPVMPTIFDAGGALDLDGQRRCADFMIDAGSDGLCILANFSEQFALDDAERELLTRLILEHVAGRVPVIVTTTHYSARVCAARSKFAQELGAAMVMIMPPYHGATIRVDPRGIRSFYDTVSQALTIPIMIQDAPVAGTPLPAPLLAELARDIPNVAYFKIEVAQAAEKLRALIALGGAAVQGPWDGEEAITLMADLDAGATGTMTGGGFPDVIGPIIRTFLQGERSSAVALYNRALPLINFENRQCGLLAAKTLMQHGGVIRSGASRAPLAALSVATVNGLLEVASALDPLVLRWGR